MKRIDKLVQALKLSSEIDQLLKQNCYDSKIDTLLVDMKKLTRPALVLIQGRESE